MLSLNWLWLNLLILNYIVNAENITDDAYFYGQVPAVSYSPMPGSRPWATAYSKAVKLVSQMTLEERVNITVGYSTATGCVGATGSVPRLNWTGLCMQDAGNGVRATDMVNAYPAGLHSGASWNRALTNLRAAHMGREYRAKGVHVLLGPVVGPLGRVALGGRNWEGFSNDPYLSGELVGETIRGVQDQGVTTSVKHYIANEQENFRNPTVYGNVTSNITVESVSTNIDDKTMHELYLWPFVDAIQAGTGSVMCSYQRINNSYACHNSKSQNGILKGELGFEGFIVSDWGAQHTGWTSAEGGLDVAMPNSNRYWGAKGELLAAAVTNGSLPEARVTDMATRIVASWYQMGQDVGFPEVGLWKAADYYGPHKAVNARDPASKPILLQGAIEGHVLVKNVNKTLPFKKPQMLSIFGYDAIATSASTQLQRTRPPAGTAYVNGTLSVGGGSGASSPAYISSPFDALQNKAYEDDTTLFWDFQSANPLVDTSSDACLVFVNSWAAESYDRPNLHDDFSDGLIKNVATNCSNTVVVIHNAGPRLVDQWIDHENITAVIFGHLPGQDAGRAIVSILYGEQSPSGKLPYTVARNESQYNSVPVKPEAEYGLFPQDNFTDGVYIDYRDFDKKNITPRYEFGFGLTYTTFSFSNLSAAFLPGVSTSSLPPSSSIIEGGTASLFDVIARVEACVTNTGDVGAMEVAQLYIGIPGGPIRQLRGFDKVSIDPGETATVSFDLKRRDLSEWNVVQQAWTLQKGEYEIWVGSSSRDLPLNGKLTID
ncbi:hypothetical protein HYFRA_00001404 [Hymenoscyphus fraxineus]|uniref:beta-glucosidase n=1 Tax=Hymenoscyphus fraxineus TaxID=746836 RepID=A0A9N9L878_9HELO|nr:hypothetical protein HYFRA_00001404 [Hymenoscyphus fraxineus]